MYDETQGIVDIAVKLYMLAQWSVIDEKSEMLTPNIIREVALKNFHAVRPILQALRTKDIDALSRIKDIVPLNIDQIFKQTVRRVIISGTLDTLGNQEQPNLAEVKELLESPEGQITALLVGAGYSVSMAQQWAHQAVQRFDKDSNLKLATSEAFRLAAEHEMNASNTAPSQQQFPKATKAAKVLSLSGDLREITKSALKKKTSVYEALNAAGVIKPATEFLGGIGG